MIRPILLVTMAALLGCPGSDPQPLLFKGGDTFNSGTCSIVGGGSSEFFAYSRDESGIRSVRYLRHRAEASDDLELVGEIAGGTLPLLVSDEVAVGLGSDGMITLVDLTISPLSSTVVPVRLYSAPDSLAILDRWLLLATERTLTLVDLVTASQSRVDVGVPVTSVVAAAESFVAFTTSGYVHVTPAAAPTFAVVSHPVIRSFARAFGAGPEAVVAGPADTVGRSRVVRLDLRSPGSLGPVVMRSHEVDGTFAGFAWDGGATSVVAIEGFYGVVHEGWVVRERDGAFTSSGTPLPARYGDYGPSIAAHSDRLFALGNDGFGFYGLR
jgi:hypothetical protein